MCVRCVLSHQLVASSYEMCRRILYTTRFFQNSISFVFSIFLIYLIAFRLCKKFSHFPLFKIYTITQIHCTCTLLFSVVLCSDNFSLGWKNIGEYATERMKNEHSTVSYQSTNRKTKTYCGATTQKNQIYCADKMHNLLKKKIYCSQ